jgi:sigma-B regulation protein RsbU (phosphoserine phosphatase)
MHRELTMLEKLEKDLNLKQLQIRSLLTITQAINDNMDQDSLFKMYNSFLSWEMGVEKMALFISDEDNWKCATYFNYNNNLSHELIPHLLEFKRIHTIKSTDHVLLHGFDIIVPVYHKDYPIAYSIFGGIKEKEDLYNKIQFIQTVTNIIAVAIENKRLFRKQIEQEGMRRELELAKDVQNMLIPKELPKSDHFGISMIYRPHNSVGGDYLDFIKFDEHKIALCIADISGKGVAAALLMANFQAMVQGLILQYRDLETFLIALNQSVFRITKGDKFITFFIAEIDTKQKTLRYVNAGHYPPILIHPNGQYARLSSGSTVLGMFEKLPEVREESLHVASESMILAFTDGLADLQNPAGDYFEETTLVDFALQHHKKQAIQFNECLLDKIDHFRGELPYMDDIAVLTCKIF